MKLRKSISVMLFLLGAITARAQDSTLMLSLRKACQLGIEKNLNVQNAALEQEKTSYQLQETKSKMLPQVEGYSTFNYYYAIPKMIVPGEIFGQSGLIPIEIGTKFDWSCGFKASQLLYNQSYFTSLRLSKSLISMGQLSLQQKKEELVYQITQVYFLCQATQMQVDQLEITMQNTDKLLGIARLQNENGVIRKVDYSRVEVNKNNIQTQIDNLAQLYNQQLGLLKFLIGADLQKNVELTDSLSFTDKGMARDQFQSEKLTEIKLLDEQLEIASLNQKINRQSYLPSLSGFGQYYYQGQRNTFDFFKGGNDKFYKVGFVGVSLSIPIFDGLEKRYKARQNEIELQQLRNTRENTAQNFNREYADALRQYSNSLNALLRQRKNIEVANETYQVSLKGYQQQVVSLSDLFLSESGQVEARLSYSNTLLQLKNAELDLKKAQGELLNY